mmetsp:Transcript_1874/g.4189  ORF Transcript_1874/g.4189 Transcript_1874/m.4189 type:complete len:448 (+) Transcript_1874:95-1438(+)
MACTVTVGQRREHKHTGLTFGEAFWLNSQGRADGASKRKMFFSHSVSSPASRSTRSADMSDDAARRWATRSALRTMNTDAMFDSAVAPPWEVEEFLWWLLQRFGKLSKALRSFDLADSGRICLSAFEEGIQIYGFHAYVQYHPEYFDRTMAAEQPAKRARRIFRALCGSQSVGLCADDIRQAAYDLSLDLASQFETGYVGRPIPNLDVDPLLRYAAWFGRREGRTWQTVGSEEFHTSEMLELLRESDSRNWPSELVSPEERAQSPVFRARPPPRRPDRSPPRAATSPSRFRQDLSPGPGGGRFTRARTPPRLDAYPERRTVSVYLGRPERSVTPPRRGAASPDRSTRRVRGDVSPLPRSRPGGDADGWPTALAGGDTVLWDARTSQHKRLPTTVINTQELHQMFPRNCADAVGLVPIGGVYDSTVLPDSAGDFRLLPGKTYVVPYVD